MKYLQDLHVLCQWHQTSCGHGVILLYMIGVCNGCLQVSCLLPCVWWRHMYDNGLVQTMIFQLYVWVYVLHMATYGRVGNEIEATPGGGLSLYIGVWCIACLLSTLPSADLLEVFFLFIFCCVLNKMRVIKIGSHEQVQTSLIC